MHKHLTGLAVGLLEDTDLFQINFLVSLFFFLPCLIWKDDAVSRQCLWWHRNTGNGEFIFHLFGLCVVALICEYANPCFWVCKFLMKAGCVDGFDNVVSIARLGIWCCLSSKPPLWTFFAAPYTFLTGYFGLDPAISLKVDSLLQSLSLREHFF